MSDLETAIFWAVRAHTGQVDKSGQPYILHPLRVMLAMETEAERIVAVLHDVVEDCGVTLGAVEATFSQSIANAIEAVSRQEGETYPQFIQRCRRNPLARKVMVADITDNLRPGCPESLQERYSDALDMLVGLADE